MGKNPKTDLLSEECFKHLHVAAEHIEAALSKYHLTQASRTEKGPMLQSRHITLLTDLNRLAILHEVIADQIEEARNRISHKEMDVLEAVAFEQIESRKKIGRHPRAIESLMHKGLIFDASEAGAVLTNWKLTEAGIEVWQREHAGRHQIDLVRGDHAEGADV